MKYEFLLSNLIFAILFLILLYLLYKPGKYVKATLDNRDYFVSDRSTNPTSEEIANTLALIRQNINKLTTYIKTNKQPTEYQNYMDELVNTVSNIDISENTKNIYTSYTINKKELVFCVRSKETGEIHNINLLMYVVIHELAHIACPEYGHGTLFKKIFKHLLSEANKANVYKTINFSSNNMEYCGMQITSG